MSLRVEHVSHRFGERTVLDDVSFDIAAGSAVAIAGENGAGKSTLLRILCGLLAPTQGQVRYGDTPVRAARDKLAMVFQHFSLVPSLTVAENIVLGDEPRRFGVFDATAARLRAKELAERLGFDLQPDARTETLSIGERQRVEIAKALRHTPALVLFDEPTAVLAPPEIEAFMQLLTRLKARGTGFVLVTHKLPEIARACDRVLVLRRGKLVSDIAAPADKRDAIAAAMLGEIPHVGARAKAERPVETLLALHDVYAESASDSVQAIDLELAPGDIVGIGGVQGNGQLALFETLVGACAPSRGDISLRGKSIAALSIAQRRHAGLRAIPPDRHDALLLGFSAADNIALGRDDPPAQRASVAEQALSAFSVSPADTTLSAAAFSGGNQQKMIFARELFQADNHVSCIIACEPTRGVDFGSQHHLWQQLRAAADRGTCVLVISSDLDELRTLCDRVAVLYRGRLSAARATEQWSELELGRAMTGGTEAPA